MKRTKNKLLSSLLCCLCWFAAAQPDEESLEFGYYNFVNYKENRIYLPEKNTLQHFFLSLDSLATGRKNKVNVVHIGDSHLQADFLSNQLRRKMQQTPHFGNGGRGFLFPYNMAKTNNPPFYTVKYSGYWRGCRNSMNSHHCEWGVSGVTATTYTTESYFEIDLNPGEDNHRTRQHYTTNTIKVFYPIEDTTSFDIFLSLNDSLYQGQPDSSGFMSFRVDTALEKVRFEVKKTKSHQTHFALQGVSLENDDPGLVYHSVGVNGAKVASFLRCQKFTPHLSALHPDLVIISLGTNDAYYYNFNEGEYKQNLNELIDMIREASPNTSILLTAPGDGMRSRWQLNQNYETVKNILTEVANARNCGFWDFYDVMGGIKSIQTWAQYGLGKTDYLHLTADGYKLQGELLFRALILEEYFAEHQQITGN